MAIPVGLLAFHPVLKRIRWGGRRLGDALGKPIGEETDYAESWEVSTHPAGMSTVSGGPFDGTTLTTLVQTRPGDLLGPDVSDHDFPLLIKFLDAHDRLSVQVHPNNAQAARFQPGENGKTEAWVILDAAPGSRLFVGLKQGITPDVLQAALETGRVEDCLHSYNVSPGDCIFIPAGTVHAIGEGILLAEIQQSSNLTFRLYDWGRVGSDGLPRELHISQALECIDFERGPVDPVQPRVISERSPRSELLVDCEQFWIRRHTASAPFDLETAGWFRVLMVLRGAADISAGNDCLRQRCGGTVFVPACCAGVRCEPLAGDDLVVLEASVGGQGHADI